MVPVTGSKLTVPPAVPPVCVSVLPSLAKKSSLPKMSMLVVAPNGAVPESSVAVGVNGLVSVLFGLPSISQSAASHAPLGVKLCSTIFKSQESVGSVGISPCPIALISSSLGTPSPSQSPPLVAVRVTSPIFKLQASCGSVAGPLVPVPPGVPSPSGSISSSFVTPSPSQSPVRKAEVALAYT